MEPQVKEEWQKGGKSPNPTGRPKGTGKPVSKLRQPLNQLLKIVPKCVEVIEAVQSGKGEYTKEQTDMSKWVIQSVVTLTRAATADEESRKTPEIESDDNKDKETVRPKFTTEIIK